jgi:hypothetical protein
MMQSNKNETSNQLAADSRQRRYQLFVICYTDDLFLRTAPKDSTISTLPLEP